MTVIHHDHFSIHPVRKPVEIPASRDYSLLWIFAVVALLAFLCFTGEMYWAVGWLALCGACLLVIAWMAQRAPEMPGHD